MKIHFFIFSFILFLGCGFFSQKDKNKEKAIKLLTEITTRHNEMKPQLEQLATLGKNIEQHSTSTAQIELATIGYSINGIYEDWKNELEQFNQQEVYMNYDLQVMRLERLEEGLNKLEQLTAKAKQKSPEPLPTDKK